MRALFRGDPLLVAQLHTRLDPLAQRGRIGVGTRLVSRAVKKTPNPYVPPNAPSETPPITAPRASGALLLAFALGVLGGGVLVAQFSFGLRRFGGLEYVPRVVVLAATRALAGGPAALAAGLVAVRALHRAGPRNERALPGAWAFVATLTAAIPSYVGLLTGAIGTSVAFGIAVALYPEAMRTGVELGDALVGVAHVLVDACVVAGVVHFGRRAWRSPAWSLTGKWVVAFLVLRIASTLASTLASLAIPGADADPTPTQLRDPTGNRLGSRGPIFDPRCPRCIPPDRID